MYIGADHAGFALKEKLVALLAQQGFRVRDLGARVLVPGDDYPAIAAKVARAVGAGKGMGVLLCGSGAGVCFTANKFPGVRASLATSPAALCSMRADDDLNILCLPARFCSYARARAMLREFLETTFSGAVRHRRRLRAVSRIEAQQRV